MAAKYLIVLQILYHMMMSVNGCQWTTNDTNGNIVSLDFSCLSGAIVNSTDGGDDPHGYLYSVCTQQEECNGEMVMVKQTAGTDLCYIVSRWDASVVPTYSSDNGGTWNFVYQNGDSCGMYAREWEPEFVCAPNTDYEPGEVEETSPCHYKVTIRTMYACTSAQRHCGGSSSSSSGLSGGWVFIIILISVFFAYCIIGYFVTAYTVNKDGGVKDFQNNIPNKELWSNCIPLVMAGCAVTKDYIMALTNKNGGGDQDESLVDNDAGDNETAT